MALRHGGLTPLEIGPSGIGGLLVLTSGEVTPRMTRALSVMPGMAGMVAGWINASRAPGPESWEADSWAYAMTQLPYTTPGQLSPGRFSFTGPSAALPSELLALVSPEPVSGAYPAWTSHLTMLAEDMKWRVRSQTRSYPLVWLVVSISHHKASIGLWRADLGASPAVDLIAHPPVAEPVTIDQDYVSGRWMFDIAVLDDDTSYRNLTRLLDAVDKVNVMRTRTGCRLTL
ncbi:hypothetical protein GCM10011505_03540 [Tistrella bauzanensis]|uniref:ACT domain-containing protein n=1 Tax=Tistrella bauzanensis TaxID=657419 RepID=A0ABQ1I940_9PROT|nr:hypothetical protein [Tistrella bauzanensis]GGB25629.1 hypothetical protein GCM10011505_03540 [Tistrella bauzanensis]